ncbi:unnamed protein product [Menidia menidia]|uniref:(Atlantic silverside) hypothetical protein n=1 Tax=Menidia menidia TaxID=238744 RepID=A0A8S4AVG4_9TELE|nr:unnamed protein product [Menidia menidia]
MHSPDRDQLWCPGQSLWSLIAEHVSESELLKIRSALGCHLVDMYTEAYTEAEMWHMMWQGSQPDGNPSSRPKSLFICGQGVRLADPPAVKELVRAEVKMLLQTLKERASREGRDVEELLSHYKIQTINYTLGHQDICYSNCGNPKENGNPSRPSSRCSVQSTAEEEIGEIRDKLNVNEIHRVVSHLRFILLEECEALAAIIKNLKGNVKEKYQSDSEKSEPSLSELRELRGAIQLELELLPSSFAASTLLTGKGQKNKFRLSERQRPDTLLPLPLTSISRSPPLSQRVPRPPCGQPPDNLPHRLSSAFRKSAKSPPCSRMDTSGSANSPLNLDQRLAKSKCHSSFSPRQDDAGVRSRISLDFHKISEKNSPSIDTHLSSQGCTRKSRTDSTGVPQERKISPTWNSRNINNTPPPVLALTQVFDTESYGRDLTVLQKGKVRAKNRQRLVESGGCSESTAVQTETSSSEGSAMCETHTHDVRNSREVEGHLRKDVNKQQRLTGHRLADYASHFPESMDALREDIMCTRPQPAEAKAQSFKTPKTTNGAVQDTRSQTQLQPLTSCKHDVRVA